MKKFKIESVHTVSEEHYTEGEGDYVNEYELDCEVVAETYDKAIAQYFENYLNLSFDITNAYFDFENNCIRYNNLVDRGNNEILSDFLKYEYWKNGLIILFNNNTSIKVYELINIKINE